MKAMILEFLNNFWLLLTAMSTATLGAIIVSAWIKKHLNDTTIKTYTKPPHPARQGPFFQIKAALLGFFLPSCDNDAVTTIEVLQRCGFSRSSIQTALIMKPSSGLESLLPAFFIFGWLYSFYSLLVTIFMAIGAAFYSLIVPSPPIRVGSKSTFSTSAGVIPVTIENQTTPSTANQFQSNVGEIFKTLGKPFLLSLLIGALIVTANPSSLTDMITESIILNYVILLLLAIPIHFCGVVLIPIAIALLTIGFTPGAVLLFMTLSATINLDNIKALIQNTDPSVRFLFLFSMIIGAVILALPLDYLLANHLPDLLNYMLLRGELGFLEQISAVLVLYLAVRYSFVSRTSDSGGCGGSCG